MAASSTQGRKADLKPAESGLKAAPPAPDVVPAEMVQEWNAIVADMVERKILTAAALGLLETYVLARWSVREAQRAIDKHGVIVVTGKQNILKPNPACGLMSKAQDTVTRLCGELGISPAARSKALFRAKGGHADDGAPAGLDL